MKKKILIPSIIALAIGGILLYNTMDHDQNNKVNPKTYKEYNFATNLGFSESSITKNEISLTKEQELSELFGTPVTNKLGIPDVYLDLVHNSIAESNITANVFAIKMFYYDSLALQALADKDSQAFLRNTYRWSAGSSCLDNFMDTADSYKMLQDQRSIIKGIPKLKSLNQQADNNLGGHVFYHDYGYNYDNDNYIELNSNYSESEQCAKYIQVKK